MLNRRSFLRTTAGLGAGMLLPLSLATRKAFAQSLPLLDPLTQPKFVNPLPNPLAPNYIYRSTATAAGDPTFDIRMEEITHDAGLIDPATGRRLQTTMWAYGTALQPPVCPGYTFNLRSGQAVTARYSNRLSGISYPNDVPVDSTLHWADPMNSGEVVGPYTGRSRSLRINTGAIRRH